jgi:hypothetical protein
MCRFGEVVPKCRYHGPGSVSTAYVPVHQDASAHVGRLVDVSLEEQVPGQRAGVVMVEIAHRYSGVEQSEQIFPILMERNVEHRNVVAGVPLDATQQRNVALDAGDKRSSLRFNETKLL